MDEGLCATVIFAVDLLVCCFPSEATRLSVDPGIPWPDLLLPLSRANCCDICGSYGIFCLDMVSRCKRGATPAAVVDVALSSIFLPLDSRCRRYCNSL